MSQNKLDIILDSLGMTREEAISRTLELLYEIEGNLDVTPEMAFDTYALSYKLAGKYMFFIGIAESEVEATQPFILVHYRGANLLLDSQLELFSE